MPAHPQRRGAGLRKRNDRLAAQVVRREQRAHGNALVDAAELLVGEVGLQRHVFRPLGFQRDLRHLLHRFHGELACGSFSAGHHGVGAVQHSVGHVADLGAGGHRCQDHAFHHLRGGDNDLVHLARHADHAFLQCRHGRVAHFHGQVAASHHDAVAGAQDGFQLRNGFAAFDLGDECRAVARGLAGHVGQLPRHFHVGGVLGKAHRQVLGLEGHGGLDVLHVLGGERRRGQAATGLVDALVVAQHAAQHHARMHLVAHHALHGQLQQTVVEQQRVAGAHVARQFLVVQAHGADVAGLGARRIQDEGLASHQHDLAFGELADADLGALQVGHDGDGLAHLGCDVPHQLRQRDVVFCLAVAEIQPHHVHASPHQLLQHLGRVGCGADGGDDLGGTGHEGRSWFSGGLWAPPAATGFRGVTARRGSAQVGPRAAETVVDAAQAAKPPSRPCPSLSHARPPQASGFLPV